MSMESLFCCIEHEQSDSVIFFKRCMDQIIMQAVNERWIKLILHETSVLFIISAVLLCKVVILVYGLA